MLLCFRNCLSTPDGWHSFMGLHWLKNWDSNTHPDILQQVVCSLLEAVRAERTAMCFVPGRIYSSYNLHLGLLSSFSWVFRALKGDSPFSFLLFWNCSLQYDHDLSQRGGINKPISTGSELLSEKKGHDFGFLHMKLLYCGTNISFTKGQPRHNSKTSIKIWKFQP